MAKEYFSTSFADRYMLGRSRTMVSPDDNTYYLIALPKAAFVRQVALFVQVAYVGTTTSLSVGWAGNGETAQVAGFISADIAKPFTKGMKWSVNDNLLSNQGKWFNSGSGAVTCTIAKGDATTLGTFIVFVDYTVIF